MLYFAVAKYDDVYMQFCPNVIRGSWGKIAKSNTFGKVLAYSFEYTEFQGLLYAISRVMTSACKLRAKRPNNCIKDNNGIESNF